jgi:hypothetical protein
MVEDGYLDILDIYKTHTILDLCDLQRAGMYTVIFHFDLTAKEWVVNGVLDLYPNVLTEYVISWESKD